jgi:hypothetical protein
MRIMLTVLALTMAACTPPAAEEAPAAEAPAVEADYGPYENAWDSAEFSHFDHTLHAPSPGDHVLTLSATTNSPGGETVAVYPIGVSGDPETARIMFVIATTRGETETETVTIPEGWLPIRVTVENASAQPLAGSYTLSLAPAS